MLFTLLSVQIYSEGIKIGFHIDLRIQHKSASQLKSQLTSLSDMGYNTVIIEWEGTFPFQKHPGISNAYAFTPSEIKDLHTHAKKCNIDLISQQQTLGHLEYVLMNDRYERLKEDRYNLSQICPQRSASIHLMKELLKEMAEASTSNYLHIGGDEARLLGHCKSCSKFCESKSVEELFGVYTAEICQYVINLGKVPVLWADMVLHHPEALKFLPENTVLIDWNYGWDLDRFGPLKEMMKNKKVTFWGAAAIRSHPDNYFITDWKRHLKNLHDYVPFTRKNFKGLFLTSWATSGVYDYVREPSNHVIEIIPLRRTFPDVSMEFMKSAFVKAAKGNITEDLIFSELQQFFKIDKKQATLLWKNLSENQKSIKGKTIEDKLKQTEKYLQSAKENLNALKEIKVNSNQTNFEQLLLQQQIKVHYLKQRQIGFVIEMTGLNKKLSQEISELRDELKQIDQNYLLLFQNDFDIRSLKEDCESRSQNLNALIKLAKISE
jgi:hypothetical protein